MKIKTEGFYLSSYHCDFMFQNASTLPFYWLFLLQFYC